MLGRREFSATKVILEGDTAAGPKANWEAYREDWDEKHLDLQPDVVPTRLLVQQLSDEQKRYLSPLGYGKADVEYGLAIETFCFGLRDWENYQILAADGSVRNVDRPGPGDWEDRGKLGRALKESAVKRLGLLFSQWLQLYWTIWKFSEAQLPLSKPSGPPPGQ